MATKAETTMSRFQIIEAKLHHCGAIVRRLREEHQEAVAWLGINSHREIRDKFDASAFRRGWMIDGRLAGLGGVVGTSLSSEGFIWLALTNEASRHPYAVAREARRQLDEIMVVKHVLYTWLIPEDRTALRFATRLGFEIADLTPRPVGRGYMIAVRYTRNKLERAA